MSDTQRDHVEALRQAEERGAEYATELAWLGYEQGQRDALALAVSVVDTQMHGDCYDEPCDWCAQLQGIIRQIKGES